MADRNEVITCKCGKKMYSFDVTSLSEYTHATCFCGAHWYGKRGQAKWYSKEEWQKVFIDTFSEAL